MAKCFYLFKKYFPLAKTLKWISKDPREEKTVEVIFSYHSEKLEITKLYVIVTYFKLPLVLRSNKPLITDARTLSRWDLAVYLLKQRGDSCIWWQAEPGSDTQKQLDEVKRYLDMLSSLQAVINWEPSCLICRDLATYCKDISSLVAACLYTRLGCSLLMRRWIPAKLNGNLAWY